MFITFEGTEGSGKTTQIALLADFLREQGFSVLTTREPGGTLISEQVRSILHDVHNEAMTPEAEILLYSAARAQLVGQVIRPALARGEVVLCDRYADSTLAYQGHGRGLNLDDLQRITRFATSGLQPTLTLYFALDIHQGLARREKGNLEMNRMDLQTRAFYERVQAGYEALIAADPARWVVIDAAQGVDLVHTAVCQTILPQLNPPNQH